MANPTVHIVDDDIRLCRAMSRLLRTYNFDVQTYTSASQFLTRRLAPVPACLVLDLKMPGIGGLNLQEMLSHGDGSLPIIFMSGQADIGTSAISGRQLER